MGVIRVGGENYLRKQDLIWVLENNWIWINLEVGRLFLVEVISISLEVGVGVDEYGMILCLQKIMKNWKGIFIWYGGEGLWEDFDNQLRRLEWERVMFWRNKCMNVYVVMCVCVYEYLNC